MRYLTSLVMNDLAHGDPHAAIGIIHYLTEDKGYPMDRILRIATKTLKIPEAIAVSTLQKMYGDELAIFN